MKIFLSFPVQHPRFYVNKSKTSWAQIAYFIHQAVSKKFRGKVEYIPFGENVPISEKDILVSFMINDQVCKVPHRTIIVDNDNFEVAKWKYGKFNKYGLGAQTDHTWSYNKLISGLHGAIFKTNDVAIAKWNSNHPDVLEKKQFLLGNINNVEIVPHPIDKNYFSFLYDPDFKIPRLKMLIYNAPWRKNSVQLIQMIKRNKFPTKSYTIVSSINKTDENVKRILNEYAYLAHISYSEGFPYLANEFLCQGLVLYGHEEWWNPYGHDILKWTYDPTRQDQNLANIRQLLSNDFRDAYYKMRKEVVQTHLDRTDNNWGYLTNKLITMIQELMD